ncbi:MAG: aminotransferase class I/II-fold pyridoxal phosphate-dependent enzyme [Bacteroidota bacterium]
MIEGHGDDIHKYDGKIIHNFSSNVYYKGCPSELLSGLATHARHIQNYPSPAAEELNFAASKKFNLPEDHFLFTNGATEAFYLIAHISNRKKVAIVCPTFSEYEDACKIHGLDYDLVDKENFHAADYGLVFICNPNNPDGSVIPSEKLVRLIRENPSTTFVIDEAYIEFTNETSSLIHRIKDLPNLIVVRSLTKTFAIPGIRLGYVIASSSIVDQLLGKKMPWSVNALAIQTGLNVFASYDKWRFDVGELLEETNTFIQELSAIEWLQIQPTYTSYFLAKLKKSSAAALKDFLAKEYGILIRDATNFHRLEGEFIRLATQSPEANTALIKALDHWK